MIESVDIKDLSNITRFSTPINEGSKRKFLLMKEDYITLKFSVDNPIYFKLGDGIDNELGIFELVDLCKPTFNQNTGGYDYELRLDAYYWKWKNKKFFFTPENAGREASWSLTANLATHMKVFLKNLKALGYKFRESEFVCEIEKTVASSSKPISYDNCNLIDALTQMAEAWECEWWITDHTINFGRCEYNDPVDFKVGDSADNEGVNVNTMQRSDSQTTYATRIYAFGSDRNIPPTYRKKLVFDVKTVNGRDISDTARKLDLEYFPSSSYTLESSYLIPIYNPSFGIGDSRPTVRFERSIDYIFKVGKYTLDSGSITASTTSPSGIASLQVSLYLLYTVNGEEKEMFLQKTDVGTHRTYFGTFTFSLKEQGSNYRFRFVATFIAYNSTSVDILFGSRHLQNKNNGSSIPITFLSGSQIGKTFNAIYNPNFEETSNIIRLPEGITASTGDMYTIDNIIKGKVPASYFSKDDNETTINGAVQTRLMLPVDVPYVDAHLNMTQEESVEEIVVFDDVYAKYIGTTKEVPEPEWEFEKDEDDKPTENKYPVYSFKDTGLKNFTEDFVLDKLRLVFQTGNLSGLDFALKLVKSDDTGTTFRITRNDDYGRFLPDDVLFPQADHMDGETKVLADTYILHGFDTAFLSEDMLPNAEEELLKKAQEYVKKSQIDPSTYNCDMFCQYAYNEGTIRTFEVGDRVNLINKTYFENGRQSRIIGYEWNLDIPYDHPIYTVGETAPYSRLGAIESKVDSLSYKGQSYTGGGISGGGSSVYVIGVNDKTLPSDRNTFSAKRSSEEFVSKKKDDTISSLITFLKGLISKGLIKAESGLEVGEAIDSLLAGKGIIADNNGRIQASRVEIRDSLTVLRLIINDLQAMSGDYSFSDCGHIEKVEDLGDGTYKLWMEKRTDTDWTTLDVNDVLFSIVNTLLTGGTDYYKSWFRPVSKNRNDNTLTVVLYPDSEVPGGKNYPPAAGYNVARHGNAIIPDAGDANERAQSWMISSREGRMTFLQNMFKPIIEDYNYALSIGKFPNLKALERLPLSDSDTGIYAKNIVAENFYKIDYNGDIVPSKVDRGEWSLEVAESASPYRNVATEKLTDSGMTYTLLEQHTVTYYGCTWGCLIDKTLLEPAWNSPAWAFLSGDPNYYLSFTIPGGTNIRINQVDLTVTACMKYANRDITDVLIAAVGTEVEWLRDTKNAPADNMWKPTYVNGQKNVIHIDNSNDHGVGKGFGIDYREVVFICRVFIPVGGKLKEVKNSIGLKI